MNKHSGAFFLKIGLALSTIPILLYFSSLVGLRQTLEESENKDFLLPPITEDSGSGSSRDTSPHTRRNSSSI